MIEDVVIRQLKPLYDNRGWLMELFRRDEIDHDFWPVMSYVSMTKPDVVRGPHEHTDQADLFYFLWSKFFIKLWDNRPRSITYGEQMQLQAGKDNPIALLVPAGVVHGYRNIGDDEGLVINCPNRLYAGYGRNNEVDEIRHETNPQFPMTEI